MAAALILTQFVAIDAFASSKFNGATRVAEEHSQVVEIGSIGETADISRTIAITITDNGFSPNLIRVSKGETVRFVLKNEGELVHQFNIGTAKTQKAQQIKMKELVEHGVLKPRKINHILIEVLRIRGTATGFNKPHSVILEPKRSGEISWKFDTDANLEFACNIPGHYETGMTGKFEID